MDKELSDKPTNMNKWAKALLYICLAMAAYCTIYIVNKSIGNPFSVIGFIKENSTQHILFVVSNGIALLIGWGSGIAIHKNDNGDLIELSKERTKNLARYAYYTSCILFLVVVIAIISAG